MDQNSSRKEAKNKGQRIDGKTLVAGYEANWNERWIYLLMTEENETSVLSSPHTTLVTDDTGNY